MKRHLANIALMSVALGVALASYLVSARVAAERAAVEGLKGAIAADMEDIQGLEVELRTRARLPQLEQWNREVLALQPPKAGQFARNAIHLAALAAPPAAPTPPLSVQAAAHAPSAAVPPTAGLTMAAAAGTGGATQAPVPLPPARSERSLRATLVAAAVLPNAAPATALGSAPLAASAPAPAPQPVRDADVAAPQSELGRAIAAELEQLPTPPDPLGQ